MAPGTSTAQPSKRGIFAASSIGTSIEWYGYQIFGGAVIGHFSDRVGPNSMLVPSLLHDGGR